MELGDRAETAVEVQGVAMSLAGMEQAARALRLGGAAAAELDAVGVDMSGVAFWTALLERFYGLARADSVSSPRLPRGRKAGIPRSITPSSSHSIPTRQNRLSTVPPNPSFNQLNLLR